MYYPHGYFILLLIALLFQRLNCSNLHFENPEAYRFRFYQSVFKQLQALISYDSLLKYFIELIFLFVKSNNPYSIVRRIDPIWSHQK